MAKAVFVVTGASGFIGRALCARLAASGADVRAVSRRPESLPAGLRARALSWERLDEAAGAACVHLAGPSGLEEARRDFESLRSQFKVMTDRLLAAGFARLVFASSAAVYGDASVEPRREDSPLAGDTPYARLKLEQEARFSGRGCAVARLANVYGPGMSPVNVFSHIASQLQAGGRVTMRNLHSVRDYLHVDDAADALAALASSPWDGVHNVSTGVGTRVDALVALLAEALGRPGTPAEATDPPGAVSHLVLDPSKLSARGWRALVPLSRGALTLVPADARRAHGA